MEDKKNQSTEQQHGNRNPGNQNPGNQEHKSGVQPGQSEEERRRQQQQQQHRNTDVEQGDPSEEKNRERKIA